MPRWDTDLSRIEPWLDSLDDKHLKKVLAAIMHVAASGPTTGEPYVKKLVGSKIHKLKELRPSSADGDVMRLIFAFDSQGTLVFYLGGIKGTRGKTSSDDWNAWYATNIPRAETLHTQHEAAIASNKKNQN